MKFGPLDDKDIENVLIAVMRIKTKTGLRIQIPLEQVFTKEFMEVFPESVRDPWKGLSSCNR